MMLILRCTGSKPEQNHKNSESNSWEEVSLDNLEDFKPTTSNWQIVGAILCNPDERRSMKYQPGTGILANLEGDSSGKNIFTSFEHGDIEVKMEVLVPKGSNSGVYFQSCYEVQLFDSWGVKTPRFSDMGGIYQRWDENLSEKDRGFDGKPPATNAALPPCQWQLLEVTFHAPVFDSGGNKTKNALFEQVVLNGEVIHKNVEATGPTRASATNDEAALAPLMFQGDHGPVSMRNIKYRLL